MFVFFHLSPILLSVSTFLQEFLLLIKLLLKNSQTTTTTTTTLLNPFFPEQNMFFTFYKKQNMICIIIITKLTIKWEKNIFINFQTFDTFLPQRNISRIEKIRGFDFFRIRLCLTLNKKILCESFWFEIILVNVQMIHNKGSKQLQFYFTVFLAKLFPN